MTGNFLRKVFMNFSNCFKVILLSTFNIILDAFMAYIVAVLLLVFAWFIIVILSKSDYKFWYQNVEHIKKVKKSFKGI